MKKKTIYAFVYGFGGGVIVYILLSYLNVF